MDKQQDWKGVLKADPTVRLLKELGKPGRYYVLRELMAKPDDDAEVESLRKELVGEIVSKQLENGSWNGKAYDYENGTTHQLMKLLELGLSAQDAPVRKGIEYLLQCQAENGSFVQGKTTCGVNESNLVQTNAVLMALGRAGYGDHPGVARGYEWLCSWQQEDGSWLSPRSRASREQGEGYPHPSCGLHATCNTLLGLSATERTRQSQAAQRGAEFILSVYGLKYDRSNEPPYAVTSTPFDGAWHERRMLLPGNTDQPDDLIELITTGQVLSTLSMLGYGLENEKVRAGVRRLTGFQAQDGFWLNNPQATLGILMTIKSFYQPLCCFSFKGH